MKAKKGVYIFLRLFPTSIFLNKSFTRATPKGLMNQFMEFLSKYGVVGLAIAVIIGGATGSLVSALVADILNAHHNVLHT